MHETAALVAFVVGVCLLQWRTTLPEHSGHRALAGVAAAILLVLELRRRSALARARCNLRLSSVAGFCLRRGLRDMANGR